MAEATPHALVRVAAELGVAELADQIHLPVVEMEGYHLLYLGVSNRGLEPAVRWQCAQAQAHPGEMAESAVRSPLSEIVTYAEHALCPACSEVPGVQWLGYGTRVAMAPEERIGAQAIEVARAELLRRGAQNRSGKPSRSASVIQRQRDRLQELLRELTQLQAQAQPRPAGVLRDALIEVEDRVRADLQGLRAQLQNGELTTRLHGQIRTAAGLQPGWVVDTTPTLVGFAPFRGSNRLVRTVVETAKISETKQAVVVRVPAWVGHFLLHTDRSYRVQAVAAPDESLAITAAMLWDPTQDGPLGSLAGALEVAAEIVQ